MNKVIIIPSLLMPFCWALIFQSGKKMEISLNSSVLQQKHPGEKVYKKYCISCHQADGGGVPHLSPPLINTSFVLGDKETLVKIIMQGLKNVDIDEESYSNPMPPLGTVLKDQQIADVLTYVRSSFGNKASAVTVSDVKAVRVKIKKQ